MNELTIAHEINSSAPVVPEVRDIFSTVPRTFDGVMAFCTMLANSDLVPKDYKEKPANVMVAIQMGAELGLSPMQALQNIAVINGRPSVWGDSVLALVQASGKLEYIKEWADGETAYCELKRRGYPEKRVVTFSQEDAKRMGLAGKQGPWTQCPGRMRQMRARSFALRDLFADVLKGVSVAEEILDITPTAADVTPADEPSRPTTQEEKGASVREKMARQLPKAAPSSGRAPEPESGAPVPDGAAQTWADLCIDWKENHQSELIATLKEFGITFIDKVPADKRGAFIAKMNERRAAKLL